MITPTSWKKSSFSGGGEGNDCVEVADLGTHIAVRDSKVAGAAVTFPADVFARFVVTLKRATSL
ncbi:DUF397 domain-containing protein [Streptomyces sp. NPDC048192]|uniref:DUF397 domain-containing protein n=1 Tax=Streptomyces sp. NPDC048192 TaxID=3365510 RepID=UPI00371D0326